VLGCLALPGPVGRQRRWRMESPAAAASRLGQRARRAPRVGSPHEMSFPGGWLCMGRWGGGRDGGAAATMEETVATPLALARRGPAAHCLDGAAAAEENTLAPSVERHGVVLPPTTAQRLGEAGAAEGSGRPGPSIWRGMAGDRSCTIRGGVALGCHPPEEAAAGEENTMAVPSRQRRGSRRPRPLTGRRRPSPGRDTGVEEGTAAVPLQAARWGSSPSWTERRRRSRGRRLLHSR